MKNTSGQDLRPNQQCGHGSLSQLYRNFGGLMASIKNIWKTAPGGKFQVITRTRLAYIAYPIWRNNFQDPMYSHLTCSWWFSLIFSYHHHKCPSFHLIKKIAPLSKWTYLTGRSTGCLTLNPMTRGSHLVLREYLSLWLPQRCWRRSPETDVWDHRIMGSLVTYEKIPLRIHGKMAYLPTWKPKKINHSCR